MLNIICMTSVLVFLIIKYDFDNLLLVISVEFENDMLSESNNELK